MSIGTVADIAKILGVPTTVFFSEEPEADAAAINDLHLTRQAMRFVSLFTSIRDNNDRNALLHLAEKMANG